MQAPRLTATNALFIEALDMCNIREKRFRVSKVPSRMPSFSERSSLPYIDTGKINTVNFIEEYLVRETSPILK